MATLIDAKVNFAFRLVLRVAICSQFLAGLTAKQSIVPPAFIKPYVINNIFLISIQSSSLVLALLRQDEPSQIPFIFQSYNLLAIVFERNSRVVKLLI